MKVLTVLAALSLSFSVSNHHVDGFQTHSLPPINRIHTRGVAVAPENGRSPFVDGRGDILQPTARTTTTALHASPVVGMLSSPVGALGVLATIILIHESGHYLAAKQFGIEVEEFSVGVGPKLWGFNAFGNEFNLRALPLGGYVRFPENYNATEFEEMQKEAYDVAIAKKNAETNPTLGYKLANFFTFGAVARQDRKLEEERKEEKLEEYRNKPWWGKLKAIQEKKDEEKLDVAKVEIKYDDNPNLLQNRPWQERAVVISGGVIFNLLLSFSIYFGLIAGPAGLPSPIFDPGVKVGSIPNSNTAAAAGILVPGDVIMRVNGMALTSSARPNVVETQKAINDLISTIRATPEGEQIQLEVKRLKNDMFETVSIQPKRATTDGSSAGSNPQSIGVMLTPNYVKTGLLKTSNPLAAARLAWDYTLQLTSETAKGLSQVLSGLVTGGGNVGGSVSGPIGLIRSGSEVVATKDFQAILMFAAAISINLGVINAFPLPALDGGQLVFILAEAITRRKVNQEFQETVTGFAVIVLLFVTIQAAVGDTMRIFGQ